MGTFAWQKAPRAYRTVYFAVKFHLDMESFAELWYESICVGIMTSMGYFSDALV